MRIWFLLIVISNALNLWSQELPKQDIPFLDTTLKQLDLSAKDCALDLIVGRRLPSDNSKYILVIPEIAINEDNGQWIEYNSHIVIIDVGSTEIDYHFFESHKTNEWVSDAISIENISIKNNHFQVQKSKFAFGVTVDFANNSRPNPYSSTLLTLFVIDNNELKPILGNLEIWSFGGEWDLECAGEFVQTTKALKCSEYEQHMGYNDIYVNTKTIESIQTIENGECNDRDTTTGVLSKFRFNGTEYIEVLEK